jgi:hypothetical protein
MMGLLAQAHRFLSGCASLFLAFADNHALGFGEAADRLGGVATGGIEVLVGVARAEVGSGNVIALRILATTTELRNEELEGVGCAFESRRAFFGRICSRYRELVDRVRRLICDVEVLAVPPHAAAGTRT